MKLPRTLEPEVMDTPEEARDYDAMDHSEVNRLFVSDLLAFAASRGHSPGDVLDLGTGTALIPIEFCRQSDEGRIMAIDMAVHMLDLARYNIEAAGLTDRIQLAQVDAKTLPYRDGQFDTLMSNSIIHHIPDPSVCVREMVRVVRPGGMVFVRDLMRPATVDEVEHLVATYAGDENEHAQTMFRESLHAALTVEEMRALVAAAGWDPDDVRPTSDRHWTWASIRA